MDKIDLRSDTVTWPTPAMREAMANAPVGDDVYGEDPTVNRLETLAAERFGKEAALLVTSGTMGNVIALLTHCGRGDEAIMGNLSHTFLHEGGNPAALGGVHSMPIPTQPDGTLALSDIEDAIRADDPHYPRTKLVALENTQGSVGGQPLPIAYIDRVGELCRQYGLALHIDGARIFNAATAVGEPVARVTQAADSVSFCLSKGLCAPIGSILVGSEAFIHQARRIRKILGGGMRQAGVIAAAGIIALEEMTERLHEDHANACRLAEGLSNIPTVEIDVSRVKTNMFFFKLREDAPISPEQLVLELAKDDILIGSPYKREFRIVTHYWIQPMHVEKVVNRMRSLLT
ncbi:MAG: low-specificity L-threonine aldolase [Phototrophicales bacterium]|nr:MAG: low-specificity L-threonine aldolase [Phototrophicales bacterium]